MKSLPEYCWQQHKPGVMNFERIAYEFIGQTILLITQLFMFQLSLNDCKRIDVIIICKEFAMQIK